MNKDKWVDIITILGIVFCILTIPVFGTDLIISDTENNINRNIAITYCKNNYPDYNIKITNDLPPENRKPNKVYIERCETISNGDNIGITKDGYMVQYNRPIPKGQKETVYLVYSVDKDTPYDVVCFVSNGMIKD